MAPGDSHHAYAVAIEGEFRRLGIGIQVSLEWGTGLTVAADGEGGGCPSPSAVARHVPPEAGCGAQALAVALHGVELANVSNVDLARLETRTVRAIWPPHGLAGPTRWSIASCHPVTGHRPSCGRSTTGRLGELGWHGSWGDTITPSGHLGMHRVTPTCRASGEGPARGGCTGLGAAGLLVEVVCSLAARPPRHGGGGLGAAAAPSLRRAALLHLEATRPHTFGGLAGSIERRACRAGLHRYKDETELSILRGLLAGVTWTASRASRQQMRPSLDRPYCPKQVPETEGDFCGTARGGLRQEISGSLGCAWCPSTGASGPVASLHKECMLAPGLGHGRCRGGGRG